MSAENDYIRDCLQQIQLAEGDEVWHRLANREVDIHNALFDVFDVHSSKRIGSFARKTAIKGTSDLDLLVVLRVSEARWGGRQKSSRTIQDRVRNRLRERYPNTSVDRAGPAVTVNFAKGGERVDVVPAVFSRFGVHRRPVYSIPDGSAGWMETSPDIHGEFVRAADDATGGQLKGVARLMKRWRESQGVGLSSFYLELLLAKEQVGAGVVSYAECLEHTFTLLKQRNCRGLRDPTGVAGTIAAAESPTGVNQLARSVEAAATDASRARRLASAGGHRDAAKIWQRLLVGA